MEEKTIGQLKGVIRFKKEELENIRSTLNGKSATDVTFFMERIELICAEYHDRINPKNKGFLVPQATGVPGYRSPITCKDIQKQIKKTIDTFELGKMLWAPKIFEPFEKCYDSKGQPSDLPLKLKYDSLVFQVEQIFCELNDILNEYNKSQKPGRQNPGGDRYGLAAFILFEYMDLWGKPTKKKFEEVLRAVIFAIQGEKGMDRSLKADIQRAFEKVQKHETNRSFNIKKAQDAIKAGTKRKTTR